MQRCIVHLSIFVTLTFLASCANYDFTVNDNLVYTPKALFSEFDTPDPGLNACLAQAIADAKITEADALDHLNCSHAGIETLQGLEVFTGLIQLKLSNNKIRNLAPVVKLINLQELYLDNNVVVDPVPLYPLYTMRKLDLSENSVLQCPKPEAFAHLMSLTLPDHCL